MEVRAPADEIPRQRDVALGDDGMQHRAPVGVPDGEIGPPLEQQAGQCAVAGRRRDQQGRLAIAAGCLRVRPGVDQRAGAVRVAGGGGKQNRPVAVRGNRPNVGAVRDQEPCDCRVSAGRRPHQRRLSHPRLGGGNVGASVQQQSHQRLVTGMDG